MKVWRKTAIVMGVMTIPVKLYSATGDHDIERHNLHAEDGGRAKQTKFCGKCNADLDDANTVKGYEVGKVDIILSEQELATIKLKSAKAVEVVEFTHSDKVDPRMPEKHYFIAPEDIGRKGFTILLETMKATGLYAIGKVVFSETKETLVLLRPFGHVLMLHTLTWADELRNASELTDTTVAISEKERELGKMLVEVMVGDGDIGKFHDQYQEQLKALLEKKAMGGVIEVQAQPDVEQVAAVDAVEQLMASIQLAQKAKVITPVNDADIEAVVQPRQVIRAGEDGVPTKLEPELEPKKKTAKAKRKVAA